MVICLERGADLHLVLPFWYRLTWVVPEKGPLNGCVCVCVCVLIVVYILVYNQAVILCHCSMLVAFDNLQ